MPASPDTSPGLRNIKAEPTTRDSEAKVSQDRGISRGTFLKKGVPGLLGALLLVPKGCSKAPGKAPRVEWGEPDPSKGKGKPKMPSLIPGKDEIEKEEEREKNNIRRAKATIESQRQE